MLSAWQWCLAGLRSGGVRGAPGVSLGCVEAGSGELLLAVGGGLQLGKGEGGGAIAQSLEGVTPGEEVLGLIPAVAACSPLIGSVSV